MLYGHCLYHPYYVDVLMINFSGMQKIKLFCVEMVTAINTIKSMAVSPQMRTCTWDKQLAGYVASSFARVNLVAMTGQQGLNLMLEKCNGN